MNINKFLILSITLFFLSCASEGTSSKKAISSTPEEAIANFDKGLASVIQGESLSVIKGIVTQEVFDFYALEAKYKKRKADKNYKAMPRTVNCTITGEEALCICKVEGSEYESKYPLVKQGDNWLVAGYGMSDKKVTSEAVAEMKKYYESRK